MTERDRRAAEVVDIESQTPPWRHLRRTVSERVVVKEPQGSQLRRFVSGFAGVAGAVAMAWAGASVTSDFDFGLPVYLQVAGWTMLVASVHEFFFPRRVVLRVGAEAVSLRVGLRPRLVIPHASIRFAEHRILQVPDRGVAPRSSVPETESAYGRTVGNAVRVQYLDEDLGQRSITFGTDEARHVLEALKRVGIRTERQ